jgi:3-O-methylgallate 3,4-dioxygenase
MAEIVFGLAASHTPMVNAPRDDWPLFAGKDQLVLAYLGEQLHDQDGTPYTYEEMLAKADPSVAAEITPERLGERHDRCQAAIDKAAGALAAAKVDVAIVIGDDHKDLFPVTNLPTFAIYWADTMMNIMPAAIADLPAQMSLGARGWYDEAPTEYPGHGPLARHMIESVLADGFDVASMSGLPAGQGMAHAITFVQKRLMVPDPVPTIPVFVNTFYPPNQPSAKRCLEFGRALRRAVETWADNLRVAFVASGGLSHFMVHEAFDREILDALSRDDLEAVVATPEYKLRSGNSEVKNWIAAAAALEGMRFELLEYEPCYRSPAGTGAGLAYAIWS